MKKYLSYTDIPIYADYYSDGSSLSPLSDSSSSLYQNLRNNHLLLATEASVSIETNLAANRYIGSKTVSTDYSVTGPSTAKISFTFIPIIGSTDTGNFLFNVRNFFNIATGNGYALSGQGVYGTTLRLSNLLFKKSFLQSYSIKINPYQPIAISTNYISYDLTYAKGYTLDSYKEALPLASKPSISLTSPVYSVMHGLTTKMYNDATGASIPQTKTNIEINVDCQRTPIYNIGSKTPEAVIVTAIERTTTIQGENVGNIIDFSGAHAGQMRVDFAPLSAIKNNLYEQNPSLYNQYSIYISGLIVSQQLSVAQNSMLNGKVVIKEIIL